MNSNDSHFIDDNKKGKEFQIQVVWHQDIAVEGLFSYLTCAKEFEKLNELGEEVIKDKGE